MGVEKDKVSLGSTHKQPEFLQNKGKNQQDHNRPHHREWPQIGQQIASTQGKTPKGQMVPYSRSHSIGVPESKKCFRRPQEGCGGLGGENPAAFPKAGPIFQQPFSLPENAQTLAGIAFRAAGKSENHFPAASKFAGLFQQRISDSHSLLEFAGCWRR